MVEERWKRLGRKEAKKKDLKMHTRVMRERKRVSKKIEDIGKEADDEAARHDRELERGWMRRGIGRE